MTLVGRSVIAVSTYGSTEETDGISLYTRSFKPNYSQCLFIEQDGLNDPQAQNFKLVSWAAVRAALDPPNCDRREMSHRPIPMPQDRYAKT